MSEFELINQYFKSTAVQRDDVLLGIGDDCAILSPPPGTHLAVSTDTLISGVHFPVDTSAYHIGYKSLAVNLSDLAAMGAEPAWASLAIALPELDEYWVSQFMMGFNELAEKYNVALIGGDTTKGPLSITVNVTGFVDEHASLKRSNANEHDLIYVTGNIGDARMGLDILFNSEDNQISDHQLYFIDKLNKPDPKVEIGKILKNFTVSAIDISDGLLADLGHICKASGQGAIINVDKIPLSKHYREYSNNKPNWQMVLNAGDDYELCFTCSFVEKDVLLNRLEEAGVSVYQIGTITNSSEIICYLDGQKLHLSNSSYNHFS